VNATTGEEIHKNSGHTTKEIMPMKEIVPQIVKL
jgi:hypothetical protein